MNKTTACWQARRNIRRGYPLERSRVGRVPITRVAVTQSRRASRTTKRLNQMQCHFVVQWLSSFCKRRSLYELKQCLPPTDRQAGIENAGPGRVRVGYIYISDQALRLFENVVRPHRTFPLQRSAHRRATPESPECLPGRKRSILFPVLIHSQKSF